MFSTRLLVLGGLIAAALVWLFLALPRERPAAPRPATVSAAPQSTASPPRRVVMPLQAQAEAAPELAELPPDLPPSVPVAPLPEPSNEPPPKSPPAPIDAQHATDLFATLLAQQDGDDDDPAARLWRQFRDETEGSSEATLLTQEVRRSVRRWIDTLPESVRAHVAVVNVECRTSQCQILIADNDGDSLELRDAMAQGWMGGSEFLPDEPWWIEGGFVSKHVRKFFRDDHVLIVTYLSRAQPSGGG